MEELKQTGMLKFNPNQLDEVRRTFEYSDVGKLMQDIDLLVNWICKQNHFIVKDFGREYLERCLINNKGSVERAKKQLDKLCTFRNLMPEFLRGFDVKNEFTYVFECVEMAVLPTPTPDNYRVIITRIYGNHDQVTLTSIYRYAVVLVEYFLAHDYSQGYVHIVDTRDMPFAWVAKCNPIVIQKATMLIVETFAQRIKGLHFISGSKFLDAVVTIIKQAVSEKLKKRIHIHNDFESMNEFVPKSIMPRDYGGMEISIKELMEINFQELSSDEHIARVKFMETAATNENHRICSKFNEEYSGMPGSFKTLCVD